MQLLIDIPEDVFKRTVFYREFRELNDLITTIKALEKAVTLPKGHGRLIDADELIKQLEVIANDEWNKQVGSSKGLEDAIDIVDDAPTIIGADKESD